MAKKLIQPNSFCDIHYVSDPQFSGDKNFISYTVINADEKEDRYTRNLYLYDLRTKKNRQMSGAGDVGHVTWTKSDTLLFGAFRTGTEKNRKKEGEEFTSFYEIRTDGGEALKAFEIPMEDASIVDVIDKNTYLVTGSFDETKPRLKADGGACTEKELASELSDWKKHRYERFTDYPFQFNGVGLIQGKRSVLAIYDSRKNKLTRITDPNKNVLCAVYNNGIIAYTVQTASNSPKLPAASKMEFYYPALCTYNLKTKKTKTVIKEFERDILPLGFIDDRTLLFYPPEDDPGNKSPLEYGSFYRIDLVSGKIKEAVDRRYESSIGTSVGTDVRQNTGKQYMMRDGVFTFISTVGDTAVLRQLKDGRITELTPSGVISEVKDEFFVTGDYCVDGFDMTDGHIVSVMYTDNFAAELFLDGLQITDLNKSFEKKYELSTPEYISYKGKDKVEIHGWCMKPAGYKEGKKYPAILHIHGGPCTVFGNILHHEMQLWAANGYFVFFCNPRGSDGRGNDFVNISGKYGTVEYDNLMEFTDRILKKYPSIDKKKVGVTGGSYGGFMTNWIIGHTKRFACACSQRSIADWISFEHTSDIGPMFAKFHQGCLTRENAEKLWEHSPLKYADKAVTPTLFVCADEDYRCYHADSIAMYTALRESGVESEIAMFHGENHDLSRTGKPKNRIDRMKEILSWMDRHLK